MKKVDTRNFTWRELEYSDKALELGIDNSAPKDLIENGNRLLKFLQGFRDAYGEPIIISSGYRCPKLNKAVGGAKRSSHLHCLAADLVVKGDWDKFIRFAVGYMDGLDFDQCIIERNSKGSKWLHIGIDHPELGQRKQLFSLNVK